MKLPLTLLLFLQFVFCNAQDRVTINGMPLTDKCFEVLTTDLPDTLTTDPFKIKKVELKGDCIAFNVTYGCGCGEVNFSLVYYKDIKVYPSKIHLFLTSADKDACKALCRETLSFDLSFLRTLEGTKDLKLFVDNISSSVLYKN